MKPVVSVFELTKQLMAIPSLTGAEKEVGDFLALELEARGYRVETQQVEEDRFNVLATVGEPAVMLCTHIDTVPPMLPVREDDRYLYGRGACDTKGIIASMLEAGDRLRKSGVTNFGYLLVVGEEVNSIGAKTANTLKWGTKFVIVGEPTGNKLARAHKGTLQANLSVKGRAAHSGYPEEGVSAITRLWNVLTDCMNADWGNDAILGNGSFNVGVFHGGEKANIVPGLAMASVMIRTVEPQAQVEARLHRIVGDRAAVDIPAGAVPQFMHVVDGFETTVVSFGSDIPYLGNMGKPLLIGPGSILDAHTVEEKVRKNELIEGVELYERLVRKLLA